MSHHKCGFNTGLEHTNLLKTFLQIEFLEIQDMASMHFFKHFLLCVEVKRSENNVDLDARKIRLYSPETNIMITLVKCISFTVKNKRYLHRLVIAVNVIICLVMSIHSSAVLGKFSADIKIELCSKWQTWCRLQKWAKSVEWMGNYR